MQIPRHRFIIALALFSVSSLALPRAATAQRKAVGVQRNSHGRIARSGKAKQEFRKQTGYPHGRPGYVIDHILPLSKGGMDSPSNMEWQTKEAAKAKDHTERGGSSSYRTSHSRSRSSFSGSQARAYVPYRRTSPGRTYSPRTYRSHSFSRTYAPPTYRSRSYSRTYSGRSRSSSSHGYRTGRSRR